MIEPILVIFFILFFVFGLGYYLGTISQTNINDEL